MGVFNHIGDNVINILHIIITSVEKISYFISLHNVWTRYLALYATYDKLFLLQFAKDGDNLVFNLLTDCSLSLAQANVIEYFVRVS